MNSFKVWLEYSNMKKYIFLDIDETLLHATDEDILPRPKLKEFLIACNKIGDVYALSHSHLENAYKRINYLGIKKYIKEVFTSRLLKKNELEKKFNLKENNWVMVDNKKADDPHTT